MTDDQALLDLAFELMADGVMLTDKENRLVRVSPGCERLTGLPAARMLGQSLIEWLAPANDGQQMQRLEQALAQPGVWRGALRLPMADGAVSQTFAVEIQAIADTQGPQRLVRIATPAGASATAPHLDPLTRLPTQSLLFDRLEQALIAAQRAQRSVAILTLSIDQITRINDGLGDAASDEAITTVAARLHNAIRRSDTLGRLTNDRFVLVMQVTAQNDTVKVAEKLLRAASGTFTVAGQQIALSVSIGISLFPSDGRDREQLLKASVSAMQHAQQCDGGNYQFFSQQMNTKAEQRIRLESELRTALAHQDFILHYQPKVDIDSNSIVGAEALVRWQHPTRGLVPPGEFIPVAEDSGLIGPIGDWVLREVCLDNARWLAAGLKIVRVSVNMAAPQFRDPDMVDKIRAVLAETALPAEFLEIEITESLLVHDIERVASELARLRDLGLHIAIDDFGTGYSSLSYLTKFPITTLKIDRAFIRDLEHQQSTAEITRAIIALSRGLELDIVAEGTETAEHIDFLRRHGCHTAQGFYYSRPVSATEFAQLLRQGRMPACPETPRFG